LPRLVMMKRLRRVQTAKATAKLPWAKKAQKMGLKEQAISMAAMALINIVPMARGRQR